VNCKLTIFLFKVIKNLHTNIYCSTVLQILTFFILITMFWGTYYHYTQLSEGILRHNKNNLYIARWNRFSLFHWICHSPCQQCPSQSLFIWQTLIQPSTFSSNAITSGKSSWAILTLPLFLFHLSFWSTSMLDLNTLYNLLNFSICQSKSCLVSWYPLQP
jgi:hypothetical protein